MFTDHVQLKPADVNITAIRGRHMSRWTARAFGRWTWRGGGDCFCSVCSAGADLIGEPYQSRVIVSFLLNRIRAQQCGGFRPPVNRTAGSRPRLPAGQPLGSVSSSGVYMRETDRGRPAVLYCMAAASLKQDNYRVFQSDTSEETDCKICSQKN